MRGSISYTIINLFYYSFPHIFHFLHPSSVNHPFDQNYLLDNKFFLILFLSGSYLYIASICDIYLKVDRADTLAGETMLGAAAGAGHRDCCAALVRRGASLKSTNLKVILILYLYAVALLKRHLSSLPPFFLSSLTQEEHTYSMVHQSDCLSGLLVDNICSFYHPSN